MTGQVVGPYIIDFTKDVCDIEAWANAADAAAEVDGIDPGAYSRKVYVLPRNACPAAGVGTVGGNPSRAWIFTCDLADVFAHELGHNLGMGHAATPSWTYGDTSDIMGLGGGPLRQINAPHKEQMGWLPPEQVVAVTQNGAYDIAPLQLDPFEAPAPQALKIFKPDTNEYYYLSYRRPIGFDANLAGSRYLDHLDVHRYIGDGSGSRTYALATLADGESFVDSINNITVTQISHSYAYVTVQVQIDAACVALAPMAGISSASQSAAAGTTLGYAITVNNTDSPNCASSVFSLSALLPAGWTGLASPDTLTLVPGQSGTATLSITSPDAAAGASYEFTVAVADAAEPLYASSANAGYTVEVIDNTDTEAPSVPTGLVAEKKGKNIKLSWNASTDNVGVSGYAIWRDGARIGDTTDTGYVDSSAPSGTACSYSVNAYDAAGNMSPLGSAVTVAFAEKTNKGKPK